MQYNQLSVDAALSRGARHCMRVGRWPAACVSCNVRFVGADRRPRLCDDGYRHVTGMGVSLSRRLACKGLRPIFGFVIVEDDDECDGLKREMVQQALQPDHVASAKPFSTQIW